MQYLDWNKFRKHCIEVSLWIILLAFMILYFVGMFYNDIYVTYCHSLTFLDSLKNGSVFDFYEASVDIPAEGTAAVYFIPIYAIFAVWNLPVWIVSRFFDISIDSVGCLLWSKGLVVFFTLGTIGMLYLILKELKYEDLEYAVFLFASSLFMCVPVLAIAQYDIINMFFVMCGVYCYIVDEKISGRLLVLFSIAISMKLFALFPFLILVLIVEKRFLHIIYDVICGLLFSIITLLPWYDGYRKISESFNESMTERLFSNTVSGGLGEIPVFILGFCFILLIAYLFGNEKVENCYKRMSWLTSAFFLLFFATVAAHPYWIVMMLPFLIPVVIEFRRNLKINILLETVAECSIILFQGCVFTWVYFADTSFSRLVFKNTNIKLDKGARNIAEVIDFLGMSDFIPALYAVFIVCVLGLLMVNNPWRSFGVNSTEKEIDFTEKVSRIVRVGIVALYLLTTYMIVY